MGGGHGEDQPQFVHRHKPHNWHGGRAGGQAAAHEIADIGEALGDDTREGRSDARVGELSLETVDVGVGDKHAVPHREDAGLGGGEAGARGGLHGAGFIHGRGGGALAGLRDVEFLLRDEAGLGLLTATKRS